MPSHPRSSLLALLTLLALLAPMARSQEPEINRPGPPPLDTLDVDANGDGVPDGWYNLRDATWVEGGPAGGPSRCFRFENARPGRPARASRAFGVDGRKVEAVVIALSVRAERIGPGQRLGDEPGLLIDFLGDGLTAVRRGTLGPWSKSIGPNWTRAAKRLAIPETTRDAILSLGLLGATGVFEFDDLAITLVPREALATTNLIVNGDFELGDPAPASWIAENGARRAAPGHRSTSSGELTRSNAHLLATVGPTLTGIGSLRLAVMARGRDLRGADGVVAGLFFLDDDGRSVGGPGGSPTLLRWGGSFDWRADRAVATVPPGATRAVLQFEKTSGPGLFWVDDVTLTADPPVECRPYQVETNKADWGPVSPSRSIAAGSALDASGLVAPPPAPGGFVTAKGGHLAREDGTQARFFGVQLLPPVAFSDPVRADALADRLARSGVNLVRLGDLDSALGPARSLFDDTREDTAEFDPESLARLDHLIAALKARGIAIALEIQSSRRFRPDDDVPAVDSLPPGGGPAALFDPRLQAATLTAATALLTHRNPETGLALKDDPALAWITLFGETSLFDQVDNPQLLPASLASALKAKGQGRPGWRTVEAATLKDLAAKLRAAGVRAPIAGVSHWRREPEFAQAMTSSGLDLVDDRLFWTPSGFLAPGRRSLVWSRDGGLLAGASKKRKKDLPYAVGQWCDQTFGAWSQPYEGADLLLASVTAAGEDWDAIVRRGVFINPDPWGAAAPGTGGGEDLFAIPEAINAIPAVYALLPHAASIALRDRPARKPGGKGTEAEIADWRPRAGRLAVETPHTVALAGWGGREPVRSGGVAIETDTEYAVVAVSSLGPEPIASARRLLVTAIARVEPTGFRWVDDGRKEVADPGVPPLLAEPVRARVAWRRVGTIKGYVLDADGKRAGPAVVQAATDGATLILDGRSPGTFHYELTVE